MKRAVIPLLGLAAIGSLYLLRLDRAAGLYVDDAWYVVLAQALARGEGFRLISSAATPILPAFPPGFSMLLAPVVAFTPAFPNNVIALKMVSVAAMLGVGAITFAFLVRYRELPVRAAAVIAIVTVTMPAFVFLATSTVMSEVVFTLAQLALVLSIERAAGRPGEPVRTRAVLTSGVLAAVTLLIRSAGVASIAGAMAYLGWRRGLRPALMFVAVAAACYLPWALYAAANRATPEERMAHGGSISYNYVELLMMRRGGEPSSGRMTWRDVPERITFNLSNVFGRDVGAFLFPAAYRGADESGTEVFALSGETGIRSSGMGGGAAVVWISSAISMVMLAGFVAAIRRRITAADCVVPLGLAMVLLIPNRTFRYVLPLAPFLIGYFFLGIETVAAAIRRRAAWEFGSAFRVTAACVLVLFTFEHVRYIGYLRAGPPPAWLRAHREVQSVTDWMKTNLVREGPVASSNPGLVYLATGRKTLALTNRSEFYLRLQKAGVPYVAVLHGIEPVYRVLGFPTLFETPGKMWVAELPPVSRPPDKK